MATEMTHEEALAKFLKQIERDVARFELAVKGWAANLLHEPDLYRLGNCDQVFVCAAKLQVAKNIHNALTAKPTGATLESVHAHSLEQVLRFASRGSLSTSVTSNLAQDAEMEAWAWLEELLRGYIGSVKS